LVLGLTLWLPSAQAQQQLAASGAISSQLSPQLFATMCALYAAGLNADSSTLDTDPAFVTLYAQMQQLQGPATQALRSYYHDHELADAGTIVSRYVAFALVAGPPPTFKVTMQREQLPPDVLTLDGFSEILANFYKEGRIEERWRLFQPAYQRMADGINQPLGRIVFQETTYLRELLRAGPRTFAVIPEPLVGTRTSFRNIGEQYVVVANPALDSTGEIRHAFLHYLLDPLPLKYSQQLVVQSQLMKIAARAPRLPAELRGDWSAFFGECLVRAVELKLRHLPAAQLAKEVDAAEGDGYVLVRPLMAALAKFEASEPAMSLYFPDLAKSIDTSAEQQRLKTVAFAPAVDAGPEGSPTGSAAAAADTASGSDPELEAAINEGQRFIAAQQPAAAQTAFERAVAKVPGEPRALYGLAVAAVLEGDADRAREFFDKVVATPSAGAGEVAWSHVYLGRMDDREGSRDEALMEYRAALQVANAPDAARTAAQRGITEQYVPAGRDSTPAG
jgi:tetratricopeptide (TPR) repeat protein